MIAIFGGATPTSNDFLGQVEVTIEAVIDYGVAVTNPMSAYTLGVGQTAIVQHALSNSSDRDLRINTRFFSTSDSFTPGVVDTAFALTYPDTIEADTFLLENHLLVTGLTEGSTVIFDNGILGGYFPDDANRFGPLNGNLTFTVAPEPSICSALLCGGAALLLRRRRRPHSPF